MVTSVGRCFSSDTVSSTGLLFSPDDDAPAPPDLEEPPSENGPSPRTNCSAVKNPAAPPMMTRPDDRKKSRLESTVASRKGVRVLDQFTIGRIKCLRLRYCCWNDGEPISTLILS